MKNTQAINVFGFGKSAMEPNDELLGGKGAKLAEMSTLGLPVPAGVTITTLQHRTRRSCGVHSLSR
jgi:pyruvate,orthophosphate dikinase